MLPLNAATQVMENITRKKIGHIATNKIVQFSFTASRNLVFTDTPDSLLHKGLCISHR